jgi:hypothetical protein
LERRGKFNPPTGERFLRLIHILNSFVVRRPEPTISLPRLEKITFKFKLGFAEADASNEAFRTYLTAMGIRGSEGKAAKSKNPPFKNLTHTL